jgi:hypothetical protein
VRAYHRVDPLMDERKSHYSPAQLGAFLKVQLVAGRQAQPGQFRSLQALRDALPKPYSRHVDFLVAERDLIVQRDGIVVVDGWKEWQEGDLTVAERMKRLRERKKAAAEPDPSPDRNTNRIDSRNDIRNEEAQTLRTPASPPAIRVGIGVGSSVRELGKAPTAVDVAKPRAKQPSLDEPRLTERELNSWNGFTAREWRPFKEAWLGRGLHYAPFGSDGDDDTSQRGLLWQIAEARPNDLGRWVREAPGRTAREVISYVLEQWHSVRADAGVDDDEWEERKREERRVASGAMTRIGDLVRPRSEGSAA